MTPIFSSGMRGPRRGRDLRVSQIRAAPLWKHEGGLACLQEKDRHLAGVLEGERLEVHASPRVFVRLPLEPMDLDEGPLAGEVPLDRPVDDGAQAVELVLREARRERRVDGRLDAVR